MNTKKNAWLLIVIATTVIAVLAIFTAKEKKDSESADNELTIFHAGSLSVPFRQISDLFEKQHPGIVIKAEASGSRNAARKICDLKRQCDIMASADYKVVSSLLIPDFADFNICFASNEMVIAYTDLSKFSDRVNQGNWFRILLEDSVNFGRSDPDIDPCGYRTLMLFQLAEKFYGVPDLAQSLQKKDRFIRPKETDLLALLEAGEIDYLFIYRSVAVQHGLGMIPLPNEINLKSQALADIYKTAVVKLSGKKPGTFIRRNGEAMMYSVTIPRRAPNAEAARQWVGLLLGEDGRRIMEANGQPCLKPAIADQIDKLPETLKIYCR